MKCIILLISASEQLPPFSLHIRGKNPSQKITEGSLSLLICLYYAALQALQDKYYLCMKPLHLIKSDKIYVNSYRHRSWSSSDVSLTKFLKLCYGLKFNFTVSSKTSQAFCDLFTFIFYFFNFFYLLSLCNVVKIFRKECDIKKCRLGWGGDSFVFISYFIFWKFLAFTKVNICIIRKETLCIVYKMFNFLTRFFFFQVWVCCSFYITVKYNQQNC